MKRPSDTHGWSRICERSPLADAGELALESRQVDEEELVWRVRAAHQPQAAAGGVELSAEVEPIMEPVRADPVRLSQVLGNLLVNAILHTPKGGRIVLTAVNTPTGVRLGVQDSGPGFASEDMERVFERSYRSDKARRRQNGGSGLGLAIARSIIEAHGGTIEARNAPGAGAVIVADLPRRGPRDAAL